MDRNHGNNFVVVFLILILSSASASGAVAVPSCPLSCDLRSCPEVVAAECDGTIVKDMCQCCPLCQPHPQNYDFYDEDVEDGMMTPNYVNASHKELCAQITCSRLQTCTVNIQGIPICRCPSGIYCRDQRLRRRRGDNGFGEVCAMDGKTYRSRCFLRIKECTENNRIKVNHDGPCFKDGSNKRRGGGKAEEDDTAEKRGVEEARQERREERRLARKNEKLIQRQLKQETKREGKRKEKKAARKQERREKKKERRDPAERKAERNVERKEKKEPEEKIKRRQRRRLRRRNANRRNKKTKDGKAKKIRGKRNANELDLDSIAM